MLYVQSLTSRSDHGALGALETLYANPFDKLLTRHIMYKADNLLERRRPIKYCLNTNQG